MNIVFIKLMISVNIFVLLSAIVRLSDMEGQGRFDR
jgi:hypothetical protein